MSLEHTALAALLAAVGIVLGFVAWTYVSGYVTTSSTPAT